MERKPPTWMDDKFLATVIQGGENNEPKVTIINFTSKLAVAAGNNYMSHIFRVQINYSIQSEEMSTTLIVKTPIITGLINEMTSHNDFYVIEPKIYNSILPKMNKLLNIEFGPKNFFCPVKNGLVLKDLKEENYTMAEKYDQLDYPHCKFVFTNLAKFHAASVVCYHDDPELIKEIGSERIYVKGGPLEEKTAQWMKGSLELVAGMVCKIDGCKPAADFLMSISDCVLDKLIKRCQPKTDGLNVLNHGDLWINNMLFKYDDSGAVVDLKFIDFQITRFASPALDLLYFLLSSANEDVRENNLQDLYDLYLETLNNTLERLGCEERMSAEELQKDIKESVEFAVVVITNLLPFIMCETKDLVSTEDITTEDMSEKLDERFMNVYTSKYYNTLLPKLMKQFQTWFNL